MATEGSPSGRPPANAALRGGALIALTVLVGIGLLSQGFANEGGVIDAGTDPATTQPPATDEPETTDPTDPADNGADNGADNDTEPGPGDQPQMAEPRDPSEVIPLVLNGSGVSGAASRVRDALVSLNYTPRSPDNTAERVAQTAVYHLEGWQPEAMQLADDLGVDRSLVTLMPDPPPYGADLGAAQILIILGEDGAIAQAGG